MLSNMDLTISTRAWDTVVLCSASPCRLTCDMADLLIRIRARVHFLTTEQGGRSSPIFGHVGYHPNHNFYGPDKQEMCLGIIDLAEGEKVWPGDTIERVITLLILSELKSEIREGREWRIQEGRRLVGIGTVLEVLDLESNASS